MKNNLPHKTYHSKDSIREEMFAVQQKLILTALFHAVFKNEAKTMQLEILKEIQEMYHDRYPRLKDPLRVTVDYIIAEMKQGWGVTKEEVTEPKDKVEINVEIFKAIVKQVYIKGAESQFGQSSMDSSQAVSIDKSAEHHTEWVYAMIEQGVDPTVPRKPKEKS